MDISHIALVDRIIEGLMQNLPETSYFKQERFPYAETWWWTLSKREVKDRWLIEYISQLEVDSSVELPA